MDSPATRRDVLASVAGALCSLGCLEATPDETEVEEWNATEADIPLPVQHVSIAHWLGRRTSIAMADALERRLPRSVEVEPHGFERRRDLERRIAADLVAGSPPGSFQTVLGEELGRYVLAVTLHEIPDIMTGQHVARLRDGVRDLVILEDEPFAVPVTVDRANTVLVNEELVEAADGDLSRIDHPDGLRGFLDDLADSVPAAGLAVPADGRYGLRLVCQSLLALSGADAYTAFADGEIFAITLREAVAFTHRLLAGSAEVVRSPAGMVTAFRDREVALIPADGAARRELGADRRDEYAIVPFPGTNDVFAMHATGWSFPKRSETPRGTASVLAGLAEPAVQEAIAEATHTLPAVGDADVPRGSSEFSRAIDEALRAADTVVPALSTGCGLDPDTRRRAVQLLEPTRLLEDGPDLVGDRLLEIVR